MTALCGAGGQTGVNSFITIRNNTVHDVGELAFLVRDAGAACVGPGNRLHGNAPELHERGQGAGRRCCSGRTRKEQR